MLKKQHPSHRSAEAIAARSIFSINKTIVILLIAFTLSVAGLSPVAAESDRPPDSAAESNTAVTIEGQLDSRVPELSETLLDTTEQAVTNVGTGSELVSTTYGMQTVALNVVGAINRARTMDASGITVVQDVFDDVDLKIKTTDSGFAIAAELESIDSPHELRFDVSVPDGAILALNDDGSIDLINGDGFTIGTFKAPWAVDANGIDVTTSYSLDGDTIVQNVDKVAPELYPIVADPEFDWGWISGTIYFNRSETQEICLTVVLILVRIAGNPATPVWATLLLGNVLAGVIAATAAIVGGAACAFYLLGDCIKLKTYPPFVLRYDDGYCS